MVVFLFHPYFLFVVMKWIIKKTEIQRILSLSLPIWVVRGGGRLPSSCLNLCLIGWRRQHALPIITLVVITVCRGCVLLMVPSMHLSRRRQLRRNVSCLHIKRLQFTHTPVIFPVCLVARLANVAVVSIGVMLFSIFSVENQKVWKE